MNSRPPGWLIASTGTLASAVLVMAVAETSFWKHYLIDQRSEFVSLGGLAFITVAGVALYRRQRLLVSLPLALPWLLFPVITQGDQLIDNLTIDQMRVICHLLLAAIFGTPILILIIGARLAFALSRRTAGLLAAALLAAEVWIAHLFLGTLMIVTLAIMIAATLAYAARAAAAAPSAAPGRRVRSERFALAMLIGGVALSLALYAGFKNRPGAYQGSPAYYMDPAQADAKYPLDRIVVPAAAPSNPPPEAAAEATMALTGYGRALEELLEAYYIADRNYNYAFHNALFLRKTTVLPDFRRVALARSAGAAQIAAEADAHAAAARARLGEGDALGALVDDAREYVAFNLRRSVILERMSAEFERTQAGLQHATHLYEGEGKVLGVRLAEVLAKHRAVTEHASLQPVVAAFVASSRLVHDRYANRIVGF